MFFPLILPVQHLSISHRAAASFGASVVLIYMIYGVPTFAKLGFTDNIAFKTPATNNASTTHSLGFAFNYLVQVLALFFIIGKNQTLRPPCPDYLVVVS